MNSEETKNLLVAVGKAQVDAMFQRQSEGPVIDDSELMPLGVYEHVGTRGGRIRLRELVTGKDFDTVCTSGYGGKPGELWYVRLCPPILDLVEYYVTMTTPYILTQAGKSDWTAYLNRAMLQLETEDEDQRLYELLKYGFSTHHWNEFVFQAYHHHQYDAIFLAGLPDVKGSLPHA